MFALPLLLLPLSACGTKSYTYEVAFEVGGTGTAEVTMKFPGSPGGVTETMQLPASSTYIAEGLGPVTMSVKGTSGDVTCRIVLEKSEVAKGSGNTATPATCASEITEDTDN
ncbi:hypothetical protein [Saccharopolyspora sp. NPDC002376]